MDRSKEKRSRKFKYWFMPKRMTERVLVISNLPTYLSAIFQQVKQAKDSEKFSQSMAKSILAKSTPKTMALVLLAFKITPMLRKLWKPYICKEKSTTKWWSCHHMYTEKKMSYKVLAVILKLPKTWAKPTNLIFLLSLSQRTWLKKNSKQNSLMPVKLLQSSLRNIKWLWTANLSPTTKKAMFYLRKYNPPKRLSRSSTIHTHLDLVRDHLKSISGNQRLIFRNQTKRSQFKISFNSSIFKKLKTGISTKCNKCNQCNRTKEAIFIKTWETEIEVVSTTTEAQEEATGAVEAEAVTTTKTTKVAKTSTKDKTKVTITTRDKTKGNQECLNHHNLKDKLILSKCSSSSQQHHNCRWSTSPNQLILLLSKAFKVKLETNS